MECDGKTWLEKAATGRFELGLDSYSHPVPRAWRRPASKVRSFLNFKKDPARVEEGTFGVPLFKSYDGNEEAVNVTEAFEPLQKAIRKTEVIETICGKKILVIDHPDTKKIHWSGALFKYIRPLLTTMHLPQS